VLLKNCNVKDKGNMFFRNVGNRITSELSS